MYILLYFFVIIIFVNIAYSNVEEIFTKKNANWDVFINGSDIHALLLSDNKETLWVGTSGGLEERNARNGELKRVYTNQDGLPDNDVYSLVSDGQGGLWVGTGGGKIAAHMNSDGIWKMFNQYSFDPIYCQVRSLLLDGQGGVWMGILNGGLAHLKSDESLEEFHSYTSDLPGGVNSLLSDGQGGIWIGTSSGLAHLDSNGSWEVFDEDNSDLPNNAVYALLSDGQGGLWVGTTNGGLAHLKSNGSWEVFDEDNSDLPDNAVYALLSDGQGGLWVGTYGGLAYMNSNRVWEVFNRSNSDLPDNCVYSLVSDGQSGLWVETRDNDLTHLKSNGSWEVFDEDNSDLPDNDVWSLLSDGQGGVWVGTDGGLAYMNSNRVWEVYNKDNSDLLPFQILSLLSDCEGGIWIGTSGSGLVHLKSNGSLEEFHSYTSDLPDDWVHSLFSDGQGGLWVGTNHGLSHMQFDGNWKVYNEYNSDLPDGSVRSLLSDGSGGVWVGISSWSGGLAHMNSNENWEVFNRSNSDLPANDVWSLLSDGQGGLWVGTYGGLAHLSLDGNWKIYNEDNSDMPDNWGRSLYSDGQGGVWVGIWYGGLAHLKPNGSWEVFDEDNSDLPNNLIFSLHSDGEGGVWVGTYGGGLAHLLLIGTPEQIPLPDSPDVQITWFLNRSPFDFRKVHYIELQRSLSKNGIYETVYDASDNPIRYYADYTNCPNPWADDCWPDVEGHTPAIRGEGETQVKGYTLNTPITDPEWLEGLPRYYRLAAVIEDDDGSLAIMAENREAALMAPAVEENPRVGLALDRSAVAVSPGTEKELSLFLSSLDLFTGEMTLAMESDNPDDANITLDSTSVSLNPGETKSLNLKLQVHSDVLDSEANIRLIAKAANQDTDKSALIKVHAGTGPMVALSIAESRTRPRVMEGITVSGNIIPAQADKEVVISGNDIDSLVLTTDENGNFEGSLTPTRAGWLTLRAEYGGVTSNSVERFILPTKTHVALTSNVNQETTQRDRLRIEGTITPVRLYETKINLDIRYLDPADPEAGLKPQFVGDVAIDENGAFYRDIVVPGDGFIHVTASLSETSDFLGINTKLVIPIGQPVGEGIIVVSESGTSEFQDISKSLGAYVYNSLQTRNIPRERIRYLGLSDDGIEGIDGGGIQSDGYADKNNIRHALTEWAVSLISTKDPYKTPLNLYLIGNMEEAGFRLNDNEVLTAKELAGYLDEAESLINGSGKGFPVTIVLEGAQSEKWIEEIAGEGRIVLTSSSAKPLDQGGYAGYDNLGESSFSRYFYQFINYGSDIEASFAEANYEILKFYRHTQRPVMDADGDGVGTTKYDRYEASGKFIEYRPSGNLRPTIRTAHPDMTIIGRENNTLWAIATDPEREMKGVFCAITDPSDRTRHLELKTIEDRDNWFEIKLENFSQTGCHQVVYYAKDNAGNVSLPVERLLHVTASGLHSDADVAPKAPTLTMTIDDTRSEVAISWTAVEGADGYTLLYAPYPDSATIGSINMEKGTAIPTFYGAGMAFYVAVRAYNADGESEFSNIEWFDFSPLNSD